MAVYQGTPLPRTGARQSVPRQPAPRSPSVSGLPAARTTTSVRTRGRSATPMYGSTLPRGAMLPRAAVPRDEPVRHVALLRVVAAPRPRVALAGVAVVLALTFVGLFYLTQTFAAAAARYETDALLRGAAGDAHGAPITAGVDRPLGLGAAGDPMGTGHGAVPPRSAFAHPRALIV